MDEHLKIRLVRMTSKYDEMVISEKYCIQEYLPRGFFTSKYEWVTLYELGDIGAYEARAIFDSMKENWFNSKIETKCEVLSYSTVEPGN